MTWTTFWTLLSVANYTLAFVFIVSILRRPREPRAMLAWILALLLLPVVGLTLFLLIGEPRFERAKQRRHHLRLRLHPLLSRKVERTERKHAQHDAANLDAGAASVMALATKVSGRQPTTGNCVTIYHEDEQNFTAILEAVRDAKNHIHLEYYRVEPDETGRYLQDVLIEKVREGVEVRLLVDYIGCWHWPRSFRRKFEDGRIQLAFSLPMVPLRGRFRANNRNHRKIVVIDGQIGFTGGQNIGNEYSGRLAKFGPWRDTHVRIVGPAVLHLQVIFAEDWHQATSENLDDDAYFPELETMGTQTVQVIPSGPESRPRIMHHLLLSALGEARKSVAVVTPYFAPDTTMLVALQAAAYRGITVRLLIPSRSNHPLILWAGRSYYRELAESGVRVYEYDHRMLHSKVAVIDKTIAILGSANIDQRSFQIDQQVTTILYDSTAAQDLLVDYETLILNARLLDPLPATQEPFARSLLLGLARLASPLL